MAALLDVRLEDGRVAAVLEGERLVVVADCRSETQERLEFRDPVVKMSLGEWAVWVAGGLCMAGSCASFTIRWECSTAADSMHTAVRAAKMAFALPHALRPLWPGP